MDGLLKVTKQRFTGVEEESLTRSDAIFSALSSLTSSCEDTPHLSKSKKPPTNMDTPSKSNGDALDTIFPLVAKSPIGMSAFEQRLLEEPIDHEINVGDSNVPSPAVARRGKGRPGARGGKSSCTDIDPRWSLPFEKGWRREVVQRASCDTYDSYYFPPEGKKIRSLVEVEKYLEKYSIGDLTKENFSFVKRLIHKEPYEMMRLARPTIRATDVADMDKTFLLSDGIKSPTRGRGRGRGRGGRGRGMKYESASDSDSTISSPASSSAWGRGHTSWGQKRERTPNTGSLMPISTPGTSNQSTPLPNIASTNDVWDSSPKAKKSKLNTSFPSNKSDIVDLTDNSSSMHSTPVGGYSMAMPVTLHKNITSGSNKGPIAKKRTGPVAKKRTAPRPMAGNHTTSIISGGSAGTATLCGLACPGREGHPPTLHCSKCMMLFHPACVNQHSSITEFICKTCKPLPPSNSQRAMEVVHVPGSAGGGSYAAVMPKCPEEAVSTVDLSKIINQNQVSGQLLTLPPGVLNHLDMSQPLALKVNNKVLMIPPNCFISSDSAVKVFLPPGTLPNTLFKEKNLPINFNFYAKNNEQILNFTDPGSNPPPVTKDAASGDGGGDKENITGVTQAKLSHKQVKVVPSNECHFLKLHSGYDCMINIFKFLSIADLLRAARVCRTWTKVTCQDSLWKVVKLKGSRVSDWEQAARKFKNHNTWYLDLQGMLLSEDRNRTWHQFTAVLENLNQLRHIHFGHSPACILHAVVEKLDKLEVMCAESVTDMVAQSQMWTTNTKIDIGKFASLKQLEHLKLRGVCGLVLPAFSFSGGLVDLAVLTNLKTLVLTTMRNIPKNEFLFLNSLTSLEVLEIGDCDMWSAEVYKQLGELTKLRSVRLECGGDKPEPALAEALRQLKSLQKLELIKFPVHSTLEDALKELPKLTSFTVWPDNTQQAALVNTNTLKALKPLTTLKTLEWGIMSEGATVSLQPEEGNPDKKVECLRFLEDPVEGQEERKEKFISITSLMQQLGAALPTTKITVFKVPLSKVSDIAVATPAAAAAPAATPTVATMAAAAAPKVSTPPRNVTPSPTESSIRCPSREGESVADPVDLT